MSQYSVIKYNIILPEMMENIEAMVFFFLNEKQNRIKSELIDLGENLKCNNENQSLLDPISLHL